MIDKIKSLLPLCTYVSDQLNRPGMYRVRTYQHNKALKPIVKRLFPDAIELTPQNFVIDLSDIDINEIIRYNTMHNKNSFMVEELPDPIFIEYIPQTILSISEMTLDDINPMPLMVVVNAEKLKLFAINEGWTDDEFNNVWVSELFDSKMFYCSKVLHDSCGASRNVDFATGCEDVFQIDKDNYHVLVMAEEN